MDRLVAAENVVQSKLLRNMDSAGPYAVAARLVSRKGLPVDEGHSQAAGCCRIRCYGPCGTGPNDGNIEDLVHGFESVIRDRTPARTIQAAGVGAVVVLDPPIVRWSFHGGQVRAEIGEMQEIPEMRLPLAAEQLAPC